MDLDVVVKIYARLPPGGGRLREGDSAKFYRGRLRPGRGPTLYPFSNRRGVLRSGGGGGVTSQ